MKEVFITIILWMIFVAVNAQDEENIIDVSIEYDREAANYNDRGFRLMQDKNFSEAKIWFEKAIEIDKTNITYFENLGITLKKMKDFEGMLENYELAATYFPEEPDLYYYRGDALQELERYDEALKAYNKAIEVSGDDDEVEYLYLYYFNRGNTFLKMKRFKEALKDFNRTIELEPFYHGAFNNRGYAKFNLQDKKGACFDWDKALELGNKTVSKYIVKYCN